MFLDFRYGLLVDQRPMGTVVTKKLRPCRHVVRGWGYVRITQEAVSDLESCDLLSQARCKLCVDRRVDINPIRTDASLAACTELGHNST